MDIDTKRERQREASRRWKERNPEKVKAYDRRPRTRPYDPIKTKAWREARLVKDGYRERVNAQERARKQSISEFLREYKVSHGCIDCGYSTHHAALQFDHVRGDKALNLCFAKSITQAKKEIEKCVIRCANCHFIRHFQHHQVAHKSS